MNPKIPARYDTRYKTQAMAPHDGYAAILDGIILAGPCQWYEEAVNAKQGGIVIRYADAHKYGYRRAR